MVGHLLSQFPIHFKINKAKLKRNVRHTYNQNFTREANTRSIIIKYRRDLHLKSKPHARE